MLARQIEAAIHTAGYVVIFNIQQQFIEQYELQTIGYQEHYEYRIPVSHLSQFNKALIGQIELISAFSANDPRVYPYKSNIPNNELNVYSSEALN
jgi:hypothetical protein